MSTFIDLGFSFNNIKKRNMYSLKKYIHLLFQNYLIMRFNINYLRNFNRIVFIKISTSFIINNLIAFIKLFECNYESACL